MDNVENCKILYNSTFYFPLDVLTNEEAVVELIGKCMRNQIALTMKEFLGLHSCRTESRQYDPIVIRIINLISFFQPADSNSNILNVEKRRN